MVGTCLSTDDPRRGNPSILGDASLARTPSRRVDHSRSSRLLVVAELMLARYWPETAAGRLVRRTAAAVGADGAYRWARDRTRAGYSRVRAAVPDKPIKAEVVDEGDGTG